MPRVLIAEDDPLTRSGIELLLENSNYKIVAAVGSGSEVLELIPSSRPEMLVLDLNMPDRSGLDILRTLRSRGDERPIILLTARIDDQKAMEALQLGVNGLVLKTTAPRDLKICLDTVANGQKWLDQSVLQRVMQQTLSGTAEQDPLAALSTRERAVAAMVRQGLRNKEIADELGLTEGTVKVHLHRIFDKLGLRSRTELILLGQDKDG